MSRIQPEITSHVMIQENVIYTQKKWQSRATDLKMTQMLELVGKDIKAFITTVHDKERHGRYLKNSSHISRGENYKEMENIPDSINSI